MTIIDSGKLTCVPVVKGELSKDSNASNTVMSIYEQIGAEVGRLVDEKQKAYGNSFGKSGECLRQMFPDGVQPEQYDDLLAIVRVLDKLFRIATNPEAFGENPWKDCCGYAILRMNEYNKKGLGEE